MALVARIDQYLSDLAAYCDDVHLAPVGGTAGFLTCQAPPVLRHLNHVDAVILSLDNDVTEDDQHSDVEDRFIDIGRSANGRILVVVYTENEVRIRIISCRRATPKERRQYEQRDG
ncbi:MAG: BrnT family toxin [Roseiflexus sp.]|nr:BrnT family toxin [Roseiflexus sp.]